MTVQLFDYHMLVAGSSYYCRRREGAFRERTSLVCTSMLIYTRRKWLLKLNWINLRLQNGKSKYTSYWSTLHGWIKACSTKQKIKWLDRWEDVNSGNQSTNLLAGLSFFRFRLFSTLYTTVVHFFSLHCRSIVICNRLRAVFIYLTSTVFLRIVTEVGLRLGRWVVILVLKLARHRFILVIALFEWLYSFG